jgi:hypothetical protein
MKEPIDVPPLEDPEAKLERAFIEQFLAQQGYSREQLLGLSEAHRLALLRDARAYAAERLAEVQARAHYVNDLHHE